MLQDLSLGDHQKEVPLHASFLKIKYKDIYCICLSFSQFKELNSGFNI